jgi:hypothetical protein
MKTFRAANDVMPGDGALVDAIASDEGVTHADSPNDAARPPAADWSRLIAEARLHVDEIAFLTANRVQGIPQREIADALGWPAAKAARVRKRVDRALARLREKDIPEFPRPSIAQDGGSSLRPFFKQRLDSGHWVYALSHSNLSMCPQLPISRGPISKGEVMNLTPDQQLKEESARLGRISERLHSCRLATEQAEREVLQAHGELSQEMSAAVLEDREPSTDAMQKKIAKLQTAFDGKRSELSGAETALQKQRAIIEALEAEIDANKHAAFLRATVADRQKIRLLLDELSDTVANYVETAFQSGQTWSSDLFPYVPQDPLTGSGYRNSAQAVVSAALRLHQQKWDRQNVLEVVA